MLHGEISYFQYNKNEIRAKLKKRIENQEKRLLKLAYLIVNQVANRKYEFSNMIRNQYNNSINELAELRLFSGIVSRSLDDLAEDFFYAAYLNPEVQIKKNILMSKIFRTGIVKHQISKVDELEINEYVLSDREFYNYTVFLNDMKELIKIYEEIK